MQVYAVDAFEDNYIWIIESDEQFIVVDPGLAQPVLDFLSQHEGNLSAILLTHHHIDHTGGVTEIKETYPEAVVYGPKEVAKIADQLVMPEDQFDLLGVTISVISTPGHTREHVSYYLVESGYLFCGDALFMGGCGRVFTKDYEAAFRGLQRLKELPKETKVYAAHEYTLTNLLFSLSIDNRNQAIQEALDKVKALRADNQPSLPSTIGQELAINLFMQAETVEEFTKLRNKRDIF